MRETDDQCFGCGKPVGEDGQFYSNGLGELIPYCGTCANREFGTGEGAERFRFIRGLRAAITDMEIAEAGARRLAGKTEESEHLRLAIMAGTVVSYARPWTASRGTVYAYPLNRHAPPGVLAAILPADGTPEHNLHDTLVRRFRHRVYAHTASHGELRHVAGFSWMLTMGPGALTETFMEIATDGMERIAALAADQRRRFWAMVVQLGDELRTDLGFTDPPPLLDPRERCQGGCGKEIGVDGQYRSRGLSFAWYCADCARRDYG